MNALSVVADELTHGQSTTLCLTAEIWIGTDQGGFEPQAIAHSREALHRGLSMRSSNMCVMRLFEAVVRSVKALPSLANALLSVMRLFEAVVRSVKALPSLANALLSTLLWATTMEAHIMNPLACEAMCSICGGPCGILRKYADSFRIPHSDEGDVVTSSRKGIGLT
ncbi:hypothetical protein EPH_0022940 [Eimeria praecox]|uniref:Uncharacterized protein n=1 Tax=Eimeria praecox TaxID=51316 RepID=U6H641_9EIME|nr:hypothetical protein EPH_0022940 [Eimeria praecox]